MFQKVLSWQSFCKSKLPVWGKESCKKQSLRPRICWGSDGWYRSYLTAGKGGESLPGSGRGGGGWEKEPVRKSHERGRGMRCLCMLPARPFCGYCVFVSWLRRPCACRMHVNVCVAYFRSRVYVNCWLQETGMYRWKDFAVRVLVCGCVVCVTDFLPNALFQIPALRVEWKSGWLSQDATKSEGNMGATWGGNREAVATRERKKKLEKGKWKTEYKHEKFLTWKKFVKKRERKATFFQM